MKPPAQKQWPKGGGYYDRWQSCPWCPMKGVETRRASKIYNLQRCCMMLWHIIRNLTSFGKESFEACSFDRWFYIPHLGIQLVSSEASSPNADRCECGLKGWRVKRPEIRHQNHVKHYICSLGVSSYVQLCYCKLLNGVDHFFHNSDNSSILQLYCKKNTSLNRNMPLFCSALWIRSQNDMGAAGPRCDLSLPFTLPQFQAIKDVLHYVKCNAGPVSQIALMPKSHNHDWELEI